jgi:ABC-type multidrug transport system fused ATPase/permease subunit
MPGKSKKTRFKSDKNREAFARWRQLAIDQMTSASTMMFGLVSAGIAYAVALLSSDKSIVTAANAFTFKLFTWSFVISFVAAILLVFNRLQSFRNTAQIIKLRDDASNSEELDDLRADVLFIDWRSWLLFYVELVTFAFGGGCFIAFLWNLYGTKLLP